MFDEHTVCGAVTKREKVFLANTVNIAASLLSDRVRQKASTVQRINAKETVNGFLGMSCNKPTRYQKIHLFSKRIYLFITSLHTLVEQVQSSKYKFVDLEIFTLHTWETFTASKDSVLFCRDKSAIVNIQSVGLSVI